MFNFKCCGQCCGLLSLSGIFFLFSVGNMFATQPMFTDVEVWHDDHGHEASVNCYLGGVIYIATLAASVGCFVYDKRRSVRRPAIADASESTLFSSTAISGNFDSSSPGNARRILEGDWPESREGFERKAVL